MAKTVVLAVLVLCGVLGTLLFAPVAEGLYFHIVETEVRCFIEEVPDETIVVGKLSGRV